MIGVPTGTQIGCFVVDADAGTDSKTGEVFEAGALIQRLEDQIGCKLPITQTVITPRGGRHLYFLMAPGLIVTGRIGLINRIDVKAAGGYVIAPPSQRADGKSYVWEIAPDVMPPALPPPQLLTFIQGGRARDAEPNPTARKIVNVGAYGGTALVQEARAVAVAPPGQRNHQLNVAAFKLARLIAGGELSERDVAATLENAAVESGLAADDGIQAVRRTIASGLSAGRKQPRSAPPRSPSNSRYPDSENAGSERDRRDSELARYELTDRGNAKRFAERTRGRLIFSSQGWLYWKGGRWVADGSELEVKKGVHETVDAIKREASVVRKSETSDDEGETQCHIVSS
jgi:hypothetical protein